MMALFVLHVRLCIHSLSAPMVGSSCEFIGNATGPQGAAGCIQGFPDHVLDVLLDQMNFLEQV